MGDQEVTIPGIDIKIKLDDVTKKYLVEKGETIIISANLESYAEKVPKRYRNRQTEDGWLSIEEKEIEITPTSPEAFIHHFTCPKHLFRTQSLPK